MGVPSRRFWLGGSDQTRLIGNEAAYNGLPDGFHNAPEPGFRHGGIVIVGGPSSHTVLDGNHCHHNNGGGIVFRGNDDLRPVLLYEGFVGHPLRKDYPKLQEQPLVEYRK